MKKLFLGLVVVLGLSACATFPDTEEGRAAEHARAKEIAAAFANLSGPPSTKTRTRCHREFEDLVCESE